jgi:hypothetical protein
MFTMRMACVAGTLAVACCATTGRNMSLMLCKAALPVPCQLAAAILVDSWPLRWQTFD